MSKSGFQPYWRPDFKVQATLPDIKVVRTDFIINVISVALVLIAAVTLLQREYRAHVLRSSISQVEQRIRTAEAADNQSLKESERFRKSAQSVEELQRFFQAPFLTHELLAELASLRPEELIFSRVQFSESVDRLKGKGKKTEMGYTINITGDVRALTVLTQFKEALQQSTLLNPENFAVIVDESMQQRNTKTGITPFQVTISLTPGAASSKGGKG